jgi:putative SOS response-associated peptidase YedK
MCGRFAINVEAAQLADRFQAGLPGAGLSFSPRLNAAPTELLPVIIAEAAARHVALFRWGLVPSWSKDASMASNLINARAETLAEKPSFREAFKKRRCLVPATSFYEWQTQTTADGKTHKQPMQIALPDQPIFALAGLWEQWRDPNGEQRHTFTIITTAPNSLMSQIHNRMPVILAPEQESLWLDEAAGPPAWSSLLQAYPSEKMAAAPFANDTLRQRGL